VSSAPISHTYLTTGYLHALPDLDILVQHQLWRPGLTHASRQYFPHDSVIKTKPTGQQDLDHPRRRRN
jgi:hypothetical protein